jgi:sugar phosphate isomerase/epimerase
MNRNRTSKMNVTQSVSRRQFLARTTFAGCAIAAGRSGSLAAQVVASLSWPIASFSKVHQELQLDFDETAAVTAEAGLDGIDCPVRPAGQILPERVADDLPRLAEALGKHRLKVLLLTTAIQSVASPHAERILRAASGLGVKYYRLGYWSYEPNSRAEKRLGEIKAQLKDLAALNKELGVCAVLQNHSGLGRVGAKVWDIYEIAKDFHPDQVGIAFDLGHALIELGRGWRAQFDKLRSHFRVAYVKDWKQGVGFVPFGQGEFATSGFFKLIKLTNHRAPMSMHTEYAWAGEGQQKNRSALAKALRRDAQVLRQWIEAG